MRSQNWLWGDCWEGVFPFLNEYPTRHGLQRPCSDLVKYPVIMLHFPGVQWRTEWYFQRVVGGFGVVEGAHKYSQWPRWSTCLAASKPVDINYIRAGIKTLGFCLGAEWLCTKCNDPTCAHFKLQTETLFFYWTQQLLIRCTFYSHFACIATKGTEWV